MGFTRGLTINQTSTGDSSAQSALSLTGLNASGLAATADAAWTHRTSGGDWWTLGPYSTTTLPVAKTLSLTPGAAAARGSYTINVTLAGGTEDWSKTGTFTVKVGVPGDYNDNGVVDAADYVLWRNGAPLHFEVDAPGTVNAADYTSWRARFGKTTAGAGSALSDVTIVPEPSAIALVTLMLFATSTIRFGHR
jgi:hypothetical protein